MSHCGPLQPSPLCDGTILWVTLGSGEGLIALLPCLGEEGFFCSCCLHGKPAVATVLVLNLLSFLVAAPKKPH